MVIAGSGLLAGDCWLAIPCLWMAQGKQEACKRPRESFRRARESSSGAPGWLPGAFERAPEQWEDLGKVPGGAEEAMSDLRLRFPMFGGHRTL